MRDFDEHDPKAPRPEAAPKKHSNPTEAAEHQPWRVRKDADPDDHRHIRDRVAPGPAIPVGSAPS